ncbi:hypothetical protein H4219_002674 [Mycoemilia scoparia]|uniref:Uncharacterized protein n=1 Tax=Mycoemilia scoparia TaxID=417184 RepID=A0A9W8A0P6_9FUNG|nr:hypothetical protein H4219_002674 [Mycoemilia scoparia]
MLPMMEANLGSGEEMIYIGTQEDFKNSRKTTKEGYRIIYFNGSLTVFDEALVATDDDSDNEALCSCSYHDHDSESFTNVDNEQEDDGDDASTSSSESLETDLGNMILDILTKSGKNNIFEFTNNKDSGIIKSDKINSKPTICLSADDFRCYASPSSPEEAEILAHKLEQFYDQFVGKICSLGNYRSAIYNTLNPIELYRPVFTTTTVAAAAAATGGGGDGTSFINPIRREFFPFS